MQHLTNTRMTIIGGLMFLAVFLLMCQGGCTTPYEVQEIDAAIEVKGHTDGKTVGLNSDQEIVLQEESRADRALDVQQFVNIRLHEKLDNFMAELQYCREALADPAIGGSGVVRELPDIDNMKDPVEVRESIGITDEGDLKVVRKEFFVERLKAEREFDRALRRMTKVVKTHLRSCNRDARYRLESRGMPKDWHFAEGRAL